jgi:hypothetical protein
MLHTGIMVTRWFDMAGMAFRVSKVIGDADLYSLVIKSDSSAAQISVGNLQSGRNNKLG